jgi:hypothetical protein
MPLSVRGLVWFGVGLVVTVGSLLLDRPIVVRFTNIPLGYVIMGLGVAIMLWDAWKARHRKGKSDDIQRNKEDGSGGP